MFYKKKNKKQKTKKQKKNPQKTKKKTKTVETRRHSITRNYVISFRIKDYIGYEPLLAPKSYYQIFGK